MNAIAGSKPIPVILDTDIGSDIDDTWALAMMLKSPELDVKLVVSDTGDTPYRSKIIARMLEAAGRADVPVGVGIPFACPERSRRSNLQTYPQGEWVKDYDLARYPGIVREDGVQAIIDLIMNSPEPLTLICIGPLPNIGEALRREPRIANHCRFVGMHGSVCRGYRNSPTPSAECNVVHHTADCQQAFRAQWDMTITPLDTCMFVRLEGERYQAVRRCEDPLIRALIENYRVWADAKGRSAEFRVMSSVLYDTVAIYLAFSEDLLVMKDLGIRVTDDGFTVVDETAKRVHVAIDWKDLDAYDDFLVRRLTKP